MTGDSVTVVMMSALKGVMTGVVMLQVHQVLDMLGGGDGDSTYSGDGSNTDSGRGPSEEGEGRHNHNHNHNTGMQHSRTYGKVFSHINYSFS